jgi:two-component system, OmpR family, response regulator
MSHLKVKIFLVDDDALYLKLLSIEFHQNPDFEVVTYPTGELCLANLWQNPDVIVLDYHLNGIDLHAMNGIETLDKIKAFDQNITVLMLSSQEKHEEAIKCMTHHALDYVMKSEVAYLRLEKVISTVMVVKRMKNSLMS